MLVPRLVVAALVVPAACTGPSTHVDNPGGHRVFVDGVATDEPTLPFRYYGTSRWDALPADAGGRPDWAQRPTSGPIPLPAPASLWLFPLDLPLEAMRRLLVGREDHVAQVALRPTPADQRVDAETPPLGQSELVDRATKARLAR